MFKIIKDQLSTWQGWVSYLALATVVAMFLIAITQPPKYASPTTFANDLLFYTNSARLGQGLHPVRLDTTLIATATCKADDMVLKGYWAHARMGEFWGACFVKYGIDWMGENLTRCYEDPKEIVQAWLDSPPHRKNLLKPVWTRVGFASGYSPKQGCLMVVQHLSN